MHPRTRIPFAWVSAITFFYATYLIGASVCAQPSDFKECGLNGKFYDGRFSVYASDYALAEEVGAKAQFIYQRVIDDIGYSGAHTRKYALLVWADKEGFKSFLASIGANVPPQSTAVALHGFFSTPTIAGYRDANLLGRSLPHEFTHLIIADILEVKPQNIPLWLSEGIATHEARQSSDEVNTFLCFAAAEKKYIALTELVSLREYPTAEERLNLFYLQSQSFVEFLLEKKKRKDVFFLFMKRMAKKQESLEQAYQEAYGEGLTVQELEEQWLEYIGIKEE
ncbi:MAG: hypothetical protein ABH865_06755 [Candidatus Omnitrophota bacterium]